MDLKNDNKEINETVEEVVEVTEVEEKDESVEDEVLVSEAAVENTSTLEKEELINGESSDVITFKEILQSQIIDALAAASISILGTIVIDFILRIFDFYISDKFLFIVILFIPVVILYNVIMTTKKDKMTLGQKSVNIHLTKNKN